MMDSGSPPKPIPPTDTLPETNIAPKNVWLEYYFPIGFRRIFRGKLLVLGRVYHQPDNPGTDEHGASISVLEVMVCFTSPDVPIPSFR